MFFLSTCPNQLRIASLIIFSLALLNPLYSPSSISTLSSLFFLVNLVQPSSVPGYIRTDELWQMNYGSKDGGLSMETRAGTNTPSDEYDSYREYRVANTNMYSRIQ